MTRLKFLSTRRVFYNMICHIKCHPNNLVSQICHTQSQSDTSIFVQGVLRISIIGFHILEAMDFDIT